MSSAEATPNDHTAPAAHDQACGCRYVQGRKGWTLYPCSEHTDTSGLSIGKVQSVRGQRVHQVILDEASEFAASAGDRWTHVFASATRVKKGYHKGCLEIRITLLGRRLDGSTARLLSGYRLAAPHELYDEQAAFDKVLRGMIDDLENSSEVTPFSEQHPA